MQLNAVGHYALHDRDLYFVELNRIADLHRPFRVPSRHFVCLVLLDTTAVSDAEAHRLASSLLDGGAMYLCAWGPGCSRLHDLFDDAVLMAKQSHSDETLIPTTAHDEALEEALFFLLTCTSAAAAYAETCRASVVVSIGMSEITATVRAALADPRGFIDRLCIEKDAG